MLRHLIKKPFNSLLKSCMYKFSGASHGEHHDYSVHIDKNATWVKYKSVCLCLFRSKSLFQFRVFKTPSIKYNNLIMIILIRIFIIIPIGPLKILLIMTLFTMTNNKNNFPILLLDTKPEQIHTI
jgi:hypothetical protein